MSRPLHHIGHVWRVWPGMAEGYRRRHARMWPELEAQMRAMGIHKYVIYLGRDRAQPHGWQTNIISDACINIR